MSSILFHLIWRFSLRILLNPLYLPLFEKFDGTTVLLCGIPPSSFSTSQNFHHQIIASFYARHHHSSPRYLDSIMDDILQPHLRSIRRFVADCLSQISHLLSFSSLILWTYLSNSAINFLKVMLPIKLPSITRHLYFQINFFKKYWRCLFNIYLFLHIIVHTTTS